jgi:hypothetical protein
MFIFYVDRVVFKIWCVQCSDANCSLKNQCERFQLDVEDSLHRRCGSQWQYKWLIQKPIEKAHGQTQEVKEEVREVKEVKEEIDIETQIKNNNGGIQTEVVTETLIEVIQQKSKNKSRRNKRKEKRYKRKQEQ